MDGLERYSNMAGMKNTYLSIINKRIERGIKLGDWASYDRENDLAYCGWMSFHDDDGQGASRKDPFFTIDVVYQHPDSALVVRNDNQRFELLSDIEGKTVTFNAMRKHAFLPLNVAKECVRKNSMRPASSMFSDCGSTEDTDVRLIWKWKNDNY